MAVERAYAEGLRTAELASSPAEALSTQAFAAAVIDRL